MSFPWKIFPTGFLTALKGFKHFFNFVLQYFQHSGGVKRKQWQQKELILKNEISKIGELLTTINIWFLFWTVNEDWENTKINNRSVDKKNLAKYTFYPVKLSRFLEKNKVRRKYPNFIRGDPYESGQTPLWRTKVSKVKHYFGSWHPNFMNSFEYGKSLNNKSYPKRFGTLIPLYPIQDV